MHSGIPAIVNSKQCHVIGHQALTPMGFKVMMGFTEARNADAFERQVATV
jgi:hypothetical protein